MNSTKPLTPPEKAKLSSLPLRWSTRLDLHAVVQEGQFAQALAEDLVVELDGAEDFLVRQEVHLGAALLGVAQHAQRGDVDAVDDLYQAVLHVALLELDLVRLAFAADGQAQPFGKRIDAGHAHAVQAAGNLVAVLVELAAGVQIGEGDFGGRALGFVLVVELDAGGDAAAVVETVMELSVWMVTMMSSQ